ncbi:MAG: queuosine precursor transporter [Varibaculum sp.]|nr:queuosine precursor transporter [Varibaculum sp.]
MSATEAPETVPDDHAPQVRYRYFDLVVAAFVGLLLISNVAATKSIELDFNLFALVADGGAICFPMTYILGDVLTEIYGLRRARRVIFTGFALSILAALVFLAVQSAPPSASYENQEAFEAVLGFVPRIVAASLIGYVAGQLLNATVLAWIKQRFGPRRLWVRLLGSTLVGELADTALFCTIAFAGVMGRGEFLNYIVTGYVYKCTVELVLLPVTYRVIAWFRRHEQLD